MQKQRKCQCVTQSQKDITREIQEETRRRKRFQSASFELKKTTCKNKRRCIRTHCHNEEMQIKENHIDRIDYMKQTQKRKHNRFHIHDVVAQRQHDKNEYRQKNESSFESSFNQDDTESTHKNDRVEMYKNLKKNECRRFSREITNQNIEQWNILINKRSIQQSNKRDWSSNKRADKDNTSNHWDIHFAQQVERVFKVKIHERVQANFKNDQNDQKKVSTQKRNWEIVKRIQEDQKSCESCDR